MEKYGLSLKELEVQSVELLPDRIEMRRRRRRRGRGGGGGFDCDVAQVNVGNFNIPIANNTAAVCFRQ